MVPLAQVNHNFQNEFISSAQYKIKLIKEELNPKTNTVNTLLLSNHEIQIAIFDKEKFPYSSAEEALEFSKVNIFMNTVSLPYLYCEYSI